MGGGLIGRAIDRPVSVIVGIILVGLFGTLALLQLPIQLTPDIERPTITVRTQWPGAAPTEVEAEIIEPQEEALRSLSGLEEMVSEARVDGGEITLELQVGTSQEESLVRVTNLLSQVSNPPRTARSPVVNAARSTGPPLTVITFTSKDGKDVSAWRTWAIERIQPALERIEGVGTAFLVGGRDRTLEVAFEPTALAARGISIGALAESVRSELRDVSAGDVIEGKRRLLVRTPLIPSEPRDLEDIVLRTAEDGRPVYLGDVAKVRYGLRKPAAMVFSDDRPSIVFLTFREAGSNVLAVTRKIREVVEDIDRRLMAPRNLELAVVSDQVGYIESALQLVQQNLIVGGGLAAFVLIIFLGSFRSSVVVAIAIPVCVLGTALGMSLLGRTINVVSLAGMAFAVGMVVDNAIVVLENIDTWRTRATSIAQAALEGTREVWGAVLASTLTTAIVFVPIASWQDEVGEILRDVAVALSLAVGISLVVSVLVIPSLAARFIRHGDSDFRPSSLVALAGRFRDFVSEFVGRMARSLSMSGLVVGMAVVGSVMVSVAFLPPMEYLPTGNRPFVFGVVVPPPGYAVTEMGRIGRKVQDQVVPHIGQELDGVPPISRTFFVARQGGAFMGAGSQDPSRTRGLITYMRSVFSSIPGVFGIASQASLFGRSLGGGRQIEIELSGSSLDELNAAGKVVLARVKEMMPNAQARPNPPLDGGAMEVHVRPRRREAAKVGLTGADIGLATDALVDGAIIGEVGRPGEPRLDVVLTAADGGVDSAQELALASVAAPDGRMLSLLTVAEIERSVGPTTIRRVERRRSVTVQVAPPDDIALETALAVLRDDVVGELRASGALSLNIEARLSGAAGDLEVAQRRLAGVLGFAVLISFLLLAALFEDFLAPVVVMVTVPLAAAGGVLGLRFVDTFLGAQTFDMLTAVGFLILIGVVVNNAILVVDGALLRLRSGATLDAAVAESVSGRLRPILMSAFTSLAGLSPLVFFPGSGSELYRGVGAIVLGGLSLSTALTVLVVPALFTLLWRLGRRV